MTDDLMAYMHTCTLLELVTGQVSYFYGLNVAYQRMPDLFFCMKGKAEDYETCD